MTLARRASNWRARRELEDELVAQNVGIVDVDTARSPVTSASAALARAGIFG